MNAGLTDRTVSDSNAIPDDMTEMMRIHVRRVYDKYGQNLTRASSALGVAKNTLKKYL